MILIKSLSFGIIANAHYLEVYSSSGDMTDYPDGFEYSFHSNVSIERLIAYDYHKVNLDTGEATVAWSFIDNYTENLNENGCSEDSFNARLNINGMKAIASLKALADSQYCYTIQSIDNPAPITGALWLIAPGLLNLVKAKCKLRRVRLFCDGTQVI